MEYKEAFERIKTYCNSDNGYPYNQYLQSATPRNEDLEIIERALGDYSDIKNKIENGTLIELPRIIHPNKAEWHVQYQYPSGIIQYDICFSQEQAEEYIKRVK